MSDYALTIPNREDVIARYVAEDEREQDSQWNKGQIVFETLRDGAAVVKSKAAARKARASLLKEFAALVKRTTASVRQQGEVYAAFGHEDLRSPLWPWTWHRAVLNAARRNNTNPRELLEEALRQEWGIPELNALGKVDAEATTCTGDCNECGAHVVVKMQQDGIRKAMVGIGLRCPVCVEAKLREGGDAREAGQIGVLE